MHGIRKAEQRARWALAGLWLAADAALDQPDEAANPAEERPQFWYGGQAVIEGVMMRGQYVAAVAVRHPKGAIVTREVPLNAALYRGRIARLPFVRGLVLLWDALGLGTRALMWSADVALEEDEDIEFSLQSAAGMGLVVLSLALGIGLFFVLPAAISAGIQHLAGFESRFAADVIEGAVKLALLIGYIWAIGLMPDVKRLYGYHGAEHKTINAYEDGAELTPEVTKNYSLEHPRCGTAFLLTLVVLSVLIHMLTGRPESVPMLLLSRVGLIFPIAGIAYEVLRFTAAHVEHPAIRVLIKPNLALQHLTTREPDRQMREVAIVALQRVLAAERAAQPLAAERVSSEEVVAAAD